MFSLPDNFTSSIGTNATGVISALSPYTTLILGVLLATLVISIIISTLTHHK
jgi:hypothetical protein